MKMASLILRKTLECVTAGALILSGGLLYSQETFANTEEVINSIYHSGSPYLVVQSDKQGSSSREPGIYIRDGKSWVPLFIGPVMSQKRKGPFIAQLALTKLDERYEAVSLVDGILHLFTVHSHPENEKSYIRLGTEQTPLVDALTTQLRYLPPISDLNDLSFYQDEAFHSEGYQMLAFSVRFKEPSPVGDGMTFVVGLWPAGDGEQLEMVHPPLVIDYNYYKPSELANMVQLSADRKEFKIHSPMLSHIHGSQGFDAFGEHTPHVKRWAQVEGGADADPYFSFDKRIVRLPKNPEIHIDFNTLQFTQIYNPIKETAEIIITSTNSRRDRKLPGLLDLRTPGAKDKVTSLPALARASNPANTDKNFVIFYANGEPHLAYESGSLKQLALVSLEDPEFDTGLGSDDAPEDLAMVALKPIKHDDEGSYIHLLVSHKFAASDDDSHSGTPGFTEAIRVLIYPNAAPQVIDRIKLLDSYITEPELEERVKVQTGRFVFDNLTKPQKSVDAYLQSYDSTRPHVDLIDSKGSGLKYHFIEPNYEIPLGEHLYYREYKRFEGVKDPTGLVLQSGVTSASDKIVAGQILKPNKKDDEEFALLDAKKPLHFEKLGDASFKVFAVDASFQNGENGFRLIVVVQSSKRRFPTFIHEVKRLKPFSSLISIDLVPGRKRKTEEFNMVFSLSPDHVDSSKEVDYDSGFGTFAVSFKLNDADKTIESGSTQRIEEEPLSSENITSRLVYDEDGSAYFSITPNLKYTDRNFGLYDFRNEKKFYPSRSNKEGSPRFNWEEAADWANINGDSFSTSDSKWRAQAFQLEKMYPEAKQKGSELIQQEIFSELVELLDQMSRSTEPAEQKVLIVPEEIKAFVWQYIIAKYLYSSRDKNLAFSYKNSRLRLYHFDKSQGQQDTILDNMELIHNQRKGRNLLLADMDDVFNTDRPSTSGLTDEPFRIKDYDSTDSTDSDQSYNGEVEITEDKKRPHALYLLTAGKEVELEDFRKLPQPANTSTLYISTPEEWQAIKEAASLEMDYGLEDRLVIQELESPDAEARVRMLEKILNKPEIRGLNLNFDASKIHFDEAMSDEGHLQKVLEYAVSRSYSLAVQKGQNVLSSFMMFMNSFTRALITDRHLRKTKMVDKRFIERVLTKVFNIPLNLETLPPEDPLSILAKRDAVFKLQEAGYEGPFDLKARVIRTILSQTQNDPARAIPSSQIYFGETGTGKTFLYEALAKMLGLKFYDYKDRSPTNDANAMKVNLSKVVSNNGGDIRPGEMALNALLNHLHHFLTLPNGFRGFLLIDDIHTASPEVRSTVLGFLRSLFEAQGGMLTVTSPFSDEVVTIPVRNLNLFMTFNPTDDRSQIARYAANQEKPTALEIALASLSSDEHKIEKSFLKRWGSILNLSQFPAGAKGPELIKALVSASRDVLAHKGKLPIVSPRVVTDLVQQFPDLDARSFLSSTTSAVLEQLDNTGPTNGSVYVIMPGQSRMNTRPVSWKEYEIEGGEKSRIAAHVAQNTKSLVVDKDIEGMLTLLRIVVDSFRIPVYEMLITAIQEDARFAGTPDLQRQVMAPLLQAISDHLTEQPHIPLSELNMDPSAFGLSRRGDRSMFRDKVKELSAETKTFFPVRINASGSQSEEWRELLNQEVEQTGRSRRHVLADTVDQNLAVVEEHLARILEIENLSEMPKPKEWLTQLAEKDPKNVRQVAKDLRDIIWDYIANVESPELLEKMDPDLPPLTPYASARLYLYTLDKAITRLPWVQVIEHVVRSLVQVSRDQVLSQAPGVQRYLFTNRYSLLRPVTTDLSQQLISNSPVVEEMSQEKRQRAQQSFQSNCERYLLK